MSDDLDLGIREIFDEELIDQLTQPLTAEAVRGKDRYPGARMIDEGLAND